MVNMIQFWVALRWVSNQQLILGHTSILSWITITFEQVLTPHLAALADAGVKLEQHYR